jgi:hypothetical protein
MEVDLMNNGCKGVTCWIMCPCTPHEHIVEGGHPLDQQVV